MALGLLLISTLAHAAEADRGGATLGAPSLAVDPLLGNLSFTKSKEPVSVQANALEFDYRKRILVYKGGVVAKQGDLQLRTDQLTLTLENEEDGKLRSVIAEGAVQLIKGARTATGRRAEFDQKQRTVILSGNAVLQDGLNQTTGDRVIVYLDDDRVVIEGGSDRVQAVLFPAGDDQDEAERDETAAPAGEDAR